MADDDKKVGLKNALEKLNNAVEDLSSLHVQTFTGSVKFTPEGRTFKTVESAVQEALKPGGTEITLVAESLYKFDGDSYNFLTNDKGGIPTSAMELHKSAVEGGIKTRIGLMEMMKNVFD